MSSLVRAKKGFVAKECAWKLAITLLRQQPKNAGEYHAVRVDQISPGVLPDHEQLEKIVDEACRMTIHVVDTEADEHTFMPLFHSVGRRGTEYGDDVVARFHTLANAELSLLRQGLRHFNVDVIPTAKQLNAAIKSEGVVLTLRPGR